MHLVTCRHSMSRELFGPQDHVLLRCWIAKPTYTLAGEWKHTHKVDYNHILSHERKGPFYPMI